MNRARDAFLARAGLSGDERGAGVGRNAPDQSEQLLHDGAPADHPAQLEPMCGLVFGGEQRSAPLGVFARLGEQLSKSIDIERLRKVVERAEFDRVDRAVDRCVCSHQNHAALRLDLANRAKDVEAAEFRHLEIHQRHVR